MEMIEESDVYKYNFLVHSTRLTFCWNLHWYSSIPCYCLCEYLWISLGEANALFSIVCLSCFSKRGKQQNEKFIFRDGMRGGNELSRWWIELILTIATGYNRSCRQIRHQLLQRETTKIIFVFYLSLSFSCPAEYYVIEIALDGELIRAYIRHVAPSTSCWLHHGAHLIRDTTSSHGSIKEKVEFWEEVKNNLWALLILIMQVWKNIR